MLKDGFSYKVLKCVLSFYFKAPMVFAHLGRKIQSHHLTGVNFKSHAFSYKKCMLCGLKSEKLICYRILREQYSFSTEESLDI